MITKCHNIKPEAHDLYITANIACYNQILLPYHI